MHLSNLLIQHSPAQQSIQSSELGGGGASIKSNFIGVILFSIGSLPLQEEIRVSMTDPGKNSLQELR